MKKSGLGLLGLGMLLLSGCAVINTNNTLNQSFEEYKAYKSLKAMAVAKSEDGRHAIGYAYDYTSQDRANQSAIERCTDSNNNSEYKVNAKCELYAIGNDIVR